MTTSDDQPRACDRRGFFRLLTARGIDRAQQAGQQFIEQRRRLAGVVMPATAESPEPAGAEPTTGDQPDADNRAAIPDEPTPADAAADAGQAPGEPLKLGASPRPAPSGAVARPRPTGGQTDSR